jgi:hypothetical protein
MVHLQNAQYRECGDLTFKYSNSDSLRTSADARDQIGLHQSYSKVKYSTLNELLTKYYANDARRLLHVSRTLHSGVESTVTGNVARIAEWVRSTGHA